MSAHSLEQSLNQLRRHYGCSERESAPGTWQTLLRVVLSESASAKRIDEFEPRWGESPLSSAEETAQSTSAELAELLEPLGQGPRRAKLIQALARWWLDRGLEDAAANAPIETLREELCALPGISLALSDRILLFVLDLPAFPISRPALRVAVRHGWLDPHSPYEEAETFFVHGLDREPARLRELAAHVEPLGRDFCGVEAHCEACPLRDLLPASGPISVDGE